MAVPMSSMAYFIKHGFMMAAVTVTLVNGAELTGKVVYAFDSVV